MTRLLSRLVTMLPSRLSVGVLSWFRRRRRIVDDPSPVSVDPARHAAGWGLGPFLLGALDRPEHVRVTAHVARCPTCRQEVEDLARVAALLTLLSVPGRSRGTRDDAGRGAEARGDESGGGRPACRS